MPRPTLVLLCLALAATASGALAQAPAGNYDRDEYLRAASTLRCDCGCHPQSIHDCACGRAEELRGEIAREVASGMTGDAIIARFVAEQGDQILLAPPSRGFNLVAWIGPLVGLVAATTLLLWLMRRWTSRPPDGPVAAGQTPLRPMTDADRERLRQAMEGY